MACASVVASVDAAEAATVSYMYHRLPQNIVSDDRWTISSSSLLKSVDIEDCLPGVRVYLVRFCVLSIIAQLKESSELGLHKGGGWHLSVMASNDCCLQSCSQLVSAIQQQQTNTTGGEREPCTCFNCCWFSTLGILNLP